MPSLRFLLGGAIALTLSLQVISESVRRPGLEILGDAQYG